MSAYTEMSMLVGRVFSLVLMVATMAAPLSLTLCRVECASASASDRQKPAVHHSCHEDSAPAAVKLTAVPHACGHTSDTPAGLEQALQTLAAPVAVMPASVWVPPSVVVRAGAADVRPSPPRFFQLVSQLRV